MPATTTTNNSNKKSEVELVSERVTKTKKEIEQLKAQLQKLIDDGVNRNDFVDSKQNLQTLSNEPKTELASNIDEKLIQVNSNIHLNKAKIFNDNISDLHSLQQPSVQSSVIRRRKDNSPSKQVIKEESPKKIRHYDQEAAREYIKKQKEKRRESLKNKKKEEGFSQDIKKQRLHELRQKSLQLVSKNIQHSRERSRSRSRDGLDQQNYKQSGVNVENVAQIQNKPDAQIQNKSGAQINIRSVAKSDLVPKLVEIKPELSTEFAHPQFKNITVRSNLRDLSAIPKLDIPRHIQFDVENVSAESSVHSPSTPLTPFQHNAVEEKDISIKSNKSQSQIHTHSIHHNVTEEHIVPINSITSNQPTISEKHKAAIRIQTAFRGFLQRRLYQIALNKKKQLKEQATKEVQTVKIETDIPVWLQAPPAIPYPYNFINTVKRKLNLAIHPTQPAAVMNDVGVQSSLIEQKDNISDKIENSLNQKNSDNKNTDLKSFLSHKCVNLDIEAIKPLALTRNSSLHDKKYSIHNSVPNSILKQDLNNSLVSDSDTSKNIPEISSESSTVTSKQHSSKRAHSSNTDYNDKPKINMDKIKKLKLIQPKRLNFSTESIKSHQSLKQSEEISEHITKTNTSDKGKSKSLSNLSSVMKNNLSGRDSIIASNKCNYSQKKTIYKPIENSSNLELNQLKSFEENIKSIEPIIPAQDTLNSFRNYMKSISDEKATETNNSNIKTEISSEKLTGKQSENSKSKEISQKTSERSKNNSHSKHSENIVNNNHSAENLEEYSSNFTNVPSSVSSSIPLLKVPSISLRSSQRISNSKNSDSASDEKTASKIILRPGEKTTVESKVKSNEIHLKFEAELHLLNEFNDSLRQIMAMDKSLMELRNTNSNTQNNKSTTTYHTRDTQTSFVTKSSTDTKITTETLQDVSENRSPTENTNQIQIPTINYSRGSEISEEMNILSLNNSNDTSLITTGLEISELKDNMFTSSNEENNVNVYVSYAKENKNGHTGLSLEMFEQLIKDEDARIENLKTILKIREKALVDRTKGELAWLEIQKKHLRDSGQLQEISAIKKKQRGLLIKLEHERHEMQRLKQMQKAASKERKSVLREQRNMIKAQLSNTNTMITKIKRNTKEEKRQSGPLKVYNIKSHSESIRSETSMSRRSSVAEEIISVVSHSHSVVSHITEEAIIPNAKMQERTDEVVPISSNHPQVKTEHVKRSLLMREAALQKRRKAAEELLQWHQRLIEEEEKIAELEQAASAIINQIPTATNSMVSDEPSTEKHKFKGTQLNLLWYNMTGRDEQKFNDHMTYTMSKISLERFCKDAKKYAISRNKSFNSKKSGKFSDSDSSLSAIDVTVTELTHSKRKNSSEKCKKFKSKSPHSLSEIASQIVVTKNASKDSQEYTSDFESILSVNKESGLNTISTDDDQKLLHSIKNQNSSSKLSSADEISPSDKEIETIAEQSKSFKTLLTQSKPKVEEIISKNIPLKEQSTVEIIDDNSPSTEYIKNVLPNQKYTEELEIIHSETNQDSTSKDISTDIEHDERKNEMLELTDDNTKKVDEIINSSSEKMQNSINILSTEFVPSEHILSATLNEEIVNNLIPNSNDSEEDIVGMNNEQFRSSLVTKTYEDQTSEIGDSELDENILPTKTNENLSNTNEDQSHKSVDDRLLNQVSISKTSENRVTETYEYDFTSELDEDQLVNKTGESRSETNKTQSIKLLHDGSLNQNKNQLLSKTSEHYTTETSENELISDLNEDDSIKPLHDKSLNQNKDQLLSKTSEHYTIQSSENELISDLNEDRLFNKTDSNLNETNKEQSIKSIDDESLNQNKEQLLNKDSEHQTTETSENELTSDLNEDELFNKTDDNLSETNNDQSIKSIHDRSLNQNKEQLLSKSSEHHTTETSENELISDLNEDNKTSENVSKTNGNESNKSTLTDDILSHGQEQNSKIGENLGKIEEGPSIHADNHSFKELHSKTSKNEDIPYAIREPNENQFVIQTNDYLFGQTAKDLLLNTTDKIVQIERDENNVASEQNGSLLLHNKINKNHNNVNKTNGNNDYVCIKSSDEVPENEKIGELVENLKNCTIEALDTSRISELQLSKSTKSSVNEENEILLQNKSNQHHTDITEIKTIESDDDTEIISDEEWNQLSDQNEKLEQTQESSHVENLLRNNKNDLEEKEDSVKTSTSTSKKVESPILLSYGFVEEKDSDNSDKEFEYSTLHEDYTEDLNKNISQQDGLQSSINSKTRFNVEKCQTDDQHESDLLEENNVNQESDNEFASKSEVDLNQTYEVNLEEKNKPNEDVKNHNEEIDEKKITNDLEYIDVKKRVSEILADANIPSPRGDKSPRVQDLYVTAYDVVSPDHSSSSGSPTEDLEQTFTPPHPMYGSDEVEELLKKQLEIEQEIKEIQQQQQKEHIPYLYVREIPNKPPPPYTPPVLVQAPVSGSILPATEKQIEIIGKKAADILHKAYLEGNLQNVTLSTDDRKQMQNKNNIDQNCFDFIFDLCKESAIEHYKQFETETGPSWMHLTKRSKLAIGKPSDKNGLQKVVTTTVRQWLGYETVKATENIKRKWSGKKRDHVDDLLVVECQAEETEWTNYDRDELIVKNELTRDLMNMLLGETAQVFNNILNKKSFLS